LRSALSPKFGRLKATLVAARLGKAIAVCFGVYGVLEHQWMLLVIAFFVFISAGNEYRYVQMQEAARRSAFGGWPPFDSGSRDDSTDDRVTISPPPYEQGPNRETDIRPANGEDPFKNIFGR